MVSSTVWYHKVALVALVSMIGLACGSAPTDPESGLSEFVLDPPAASLFLGDSLSFRVVKRSSGVGEQCVDARWKSDDPRVAVVNGNGRVLAKTIGSAAIIATCAGAEASASLRVSQEGDVLLAQTIPAFPEALGRGATALQRCDRSRVQVARVKHLEDSGPGSFRNAVAKADGRRLTVVTFDVGGYVDLHESHVPVNQGCLYIAGQTAPGDGVTLRRKGILIQDAAEDIVVRHLRIRPGYLGDYLGQVPVNIRAGQRMVLDHLSVSWATDKLVMISRFSDHPLSRPISHITIQHSLIAEPFAFHPTAMNISGMPKDWEGSTPPGWTEVGEISIYSNLFANSHHRNPQTGGYSVEVVNNVIHNFKMDAGNNVYGSRSDWVGNYAQAGPMNSWRYEFGYTCGSEPEDPAYAPELYYSGNVGPHNSDPSADPWSGEARMLACYNTVDPVDQSIRRDTPLPQPTFPVTVLSAAEAYSAVIEDVGANRGLRCDGTWYDRSDEVDRRLIEDTRAGTGPSAPPQNENDVGGFPELATGSSCSDSDADGMPDAFEARYGLDPNDPSDASQDADRDGYVNLEEYLNGSLPV